MKSKNQVAAEVLMGQWGNGAERRNKLSAKGYNPNEIQEIVNCLVYGKYEIVDDNEPKEKIVEVELDLAKYDGISIKFVPVG